MKTLLAVILRKKNFRIKRSILESLRPDYIQEIVKKSFKTNLRIFLISNKQNVFFRLGVYL